MTKTPEVDTGATAPAVEPRKSRKNNPEKTRENILQEAIVEFVEQGLAGARWTRLPSAPKPPSA